MCGSETGFAAIQIAYGPVSMRAWLLHAAWGKKMVHILHARSATMKTISCATVVSHSPKEAPNMANTHSWIMSQSCTVFEGTWLLKTWAQLPHRSSVITSTRSSLLPWIYLRTKVPFANAQPLTG
jgi:hypothetical protein